MSERYYTLSDRGESELIDKKSRFLGYCAPAKTEEAAVAFIEEIRTLHPAASHHVYAYLLREQNLMRYSDDGEPQGTAGLPVLDILRRGGIVDGVLVVVRYFGGTLLGTGGLVHAYGEAAGSALQAAKIAEMALCGVYAVRCEYAQFDELQKLLEQLDAKILMKSFDTAISLEIALLSDRAERFAEAIAALTRGSTQPGHLYDRFECVGIREKK